MSSTVEPPPTAVDPDAEPPAEPHRPASGPLAVARLAALVAGVVVLGVATDSVAVVGIVLALLGMIFVHELGHFVAAKRGGMKVTEFFVGFGPRIWSFRRGDTEYGVKALPFGGYCRIIGMNNLEPVAPEDEARTYRQQPFPQRLAVAVAGTFMHAVMAFVTFLAMNAAFGNPMHAFLDPVVSEVSALQSGRSPAREAGLQVGDRIVAIDGRPVASWEQLTGTVRVSAEQPLTLDVERGGERLRLTVTPAARPTVDPATGEPGPPQGFVGIRPSLESPTVPLGAAIVRSGADLAVFTKETVSAMGRLFSLQGVRSYTRQLTGAQVTAEEQANRFVSPVGVVRLANDSAEDGFNRLLFVFAMINVFVGIFNMLPLLPFDGGHVVIAVYEAVRSRIKGHRHFADVSKLLPLAYATVALLVFIGVSSLYLDLTSPLRL